jgi:hypothetical protein
MGIVPLSLLPAPNIPIIHCPKPGLVRPDQETFKPFITQKHNSCFKISRINA